MEANPLRTPYAPKSDREDLERSSRDRLDARARAAGRAALRLMLPNHERAGRRRSSYDLNPYTSSGSCRASLAKGSHATLTQGDEDLDLTIALVP